MGLFKFLVRVLGLYRPEMKILIIGLDNSGKTTILNRLKSKENKISHVAPTVGFNVERITVGSFIFNCFDMSGQGRYRTLWEHYYQDCDAIIYVIDSADHLRLVVTQDELEQMLQHRSIIKRTIPILFLANKMDLEDSRPASEIAEILELTKIRHKPWNIIACNGHTGEGLKTAIEWLSDQLRQQPVVKKKSGT
ncbi:ADP-ribosylation factor-like protein 6 [Clonorchis sinensis]|uniref:ADP-ribosylation factor-like protein 6 n=2 Tax=Clonorchis sinensis TaxID=79923 RepID=H2KQJ5_CLOSI|nr:ADP-ribosylation factor-like protein 6 [Clonorchis sinensis]GAA28259.1 ADP-ribosylation factor-like 6 [Clonorchis sinensis]